MRKHQVRRPGEHLVQVLSTNVRARRNALGVSQEEFAAICGLHRTYVGSVERGERNVTLSTLEVLASALGVTVPELLTPRRADGRSETADRSS